MARIRKRVRANGTIAYNIRWIDGGGSSKNNLESSFTVNDEHEAWMWKMLLDSNGQSLDMAKQAYRNVKSKAPKVSELLEEFLELKIGGVQEKTIRGYERMARMHINPVLGGIPVDQLTKQNFVHWFNGIERATKTKIEILSLLSSTLNYGIEEGYLDKNLTSVVRRQPNLKNYQTLEKVFLTKGEYTQLVDAIDPYFKTFIIFLIDSGLRYGEATALQMKDFRETGDGKIIVSVTKAWKDGMKLLGPPKSRRSRREIVLSTFCSKLIREKLTSNSEDLIFTSKQGGKLFHGRFHNKYWKPAIKDLARKPRIHDLRHTHASWLLANGENMYVVSRRLGHEQVSTTIDIYGHLENKADSNAADKIDTFHN